MLQEKTLKAKKGVTFPSFCKRGDPLKENNRFDELFVRGTVYARVRAPDRFREIFFAKITVFHRQRKECEKNGKHLSALDVYRTIRPISLNTNILSYGEIGEQLDRAILVFKILFELSN